MYFLLQLQNLTFTKLALKVHLQKLYSQGINGASKLRIDNNNFYFNDNKKNIYSMSISSTNIPTKPIFTTTANMYGFGVINNKIYVSNAFFHKTVMYLFITLAELN